MTKLHQIVPRGNDCHTRWDHHHMSKVRENLLNTQLNLTTSHGHSNITLNMHRVYGEGYIYDDWQSHLTTQSTILCVYI